MYPDESHILLGHLGHVWNAHFKKLYALQPKCDHYSPLFGDALLVVMFG